MGVTNKLYITCNCENPRISDKKEKCTCGLYFRKVIDCKICCTTHKVRPVSFCHALYNGTINYPDTKDDIVPDILSECSQTITDS